MKRLLGMALGITLMVTLVPAGPASAMRVQEGGERGSRDVTTIAVYGDSPYGTSNSDTAQFGATHAFIHTINADPSVGLVLHVGDIHSGSQYCTQEYDQSIYDAWTGADGTEGFADPLVYTPGDNEWADCHKSKEGGNVVDGNGNPVDYANGDPVANLALIRSMFFPEAGVTLGAKRRVLSQGFAYDRHHPSDAQFVENVIWMQSGVVFVTINVPGGSNNEQDVWYGAAKETPAQTQERQDRTGADLRWLDTAFALATLTHAKGLVIGAQADMWDPEKNVAGVTTHQEGYEPFVAAVAHHTLRFHRPVLMFNGDSHVYRSDDPLSPTASCAGEAGACASDYFIHPGYDVPNFHRVVVHGSTAPMEWLKLTVDPSAHYPNGPTSFGPFSWQRQTQALPPAP